METIGFIGPGRMGRPMALNLLARGHRLVAHDIAPVPVAVLAQADAQAGRSGNGKLDLSGIADVLRDLATIEPPRVPAGWRPA